MKIHLAPEPEDVIWENMEFTFCQRFKRIIIIYSLTILLIVCAFQIVFSLNKLQGSIKVENWAVILKYTASFSISIVTLPIDFADFTLRYAKHIDNIKFAVEGVDKADPRYELIKENAEDEFNYWLNMYPTYDAVNTAQINAMKNNKQQSDDKKDKELFTKVVDIDMVNTWSSVIQEEMNPYFWMYQSNYIIPNRNKAWRAKNTL